MRNLKTAYITLNKVLDIIDSHINTLSDTFADLQRDIILNPDSYTSKPDSKDIDNLHKLYDFLIGQYSEDNDCFKNYCQYHSYSVINHIFKTPKNSMELSPLVECLKDETKKEIEYLDQLFNIIDSSIHDMVNNKLYTFASDNDLPKRITPDELISTGVGLPEVEQN